MLGRCQFSIKFCLSLLSFSSSIFMFLILLCLHFVKTSVFLVQTYFCQRIQIYCGSYQCCQLQKIQQQRLKIIYRHRVLCTFLFLSLCTHSHARTHTLTHTHHALTHTNTLMKIGIIHPTLQVHTNNT